MLELGPGCERSDKNPVATWEVLFLLLPDSLILDWAGPAEALRMANVTMVQQG